MHVKLNEPLLGRPDIAAQQSQGSLALWQPEAVDGGRSNYLVSVSAWSKPGESLEQVPGLSGRCGRLPRTAKLAGNGAGTR